LALALEDKHNMTNKLPPVLAKHYTQKTIASAQEGNHQEEGAKDNWKLLGTGRCRLILINGLFFHLRLPPLTFGQILSYGLDQHDLFT